MANKDLVGTLRDALDPYEITKQTLGQIEQEKTVLDRHLAEQSNLLEKIKSSTGSETRALLRTNKKSKRIRCAA